MNVYLLTTHIKILPKGKYHRLYQINFLTHSLTGSICSHGPRAVVSKDRPIEWTNEQHVPVQVKTSYYRPRKNVCKDCLRLAKQKDRYNK